MTEVQFPGGVIDLNRREVRFKKGKRVVLSQREVELVQYLAGNPNRAISRDELLANVWLISPKGMNTRTIDMHITRLREKLHDNPEQPEIILTVRGKGYMFGRTNVEARMSNETES